MKQYMTIAPDGRVDSLFDLDDDAAPPEVEGFTLEEVAVPFNGWPPGPTLTAALHWRDGAFAWVETASLADSVTGAIAKIDSESDAARLLVVGDPTKIAEYQRAEAQARGYQASGYAGMAPACVECWARAKGWTGEQAALDIIATADAWYQLLERIRDLRLCAKEAVRNAADPGAVAARAQQFTADLANLMKGAA